MPNHIYVICKNFADNISKKPKLILHSSELEFTSPNQFSMIITIMLPVIPSMKSFRCS